MQEGDQASLRSIDCQARQEACTDHSVEALLDVPGEGGHHTRRWEGGLRSLNLVLLVVKENLVGRFWNLGESRE